MTRRRNLAARPEQLAEQRLPEHAPQRLDGRHGRCRVPRARDRTQPARRSGFLAPGGAPPRQPLQLDVRLQGSDRLGAQRRRLARQLAEWNVADAIQRAGEDQGDRPAPRQLVGSSQHTVDRQVGERPRAGSGMRTQIVGHRR